MICNSTFEFFHRIINKNDPSFFAFERTFSNCVVIVVIKNVECQQNIGKRLFSIHDALIIRRTLVTEFVFSRPLKKKFWVVTDIVFYVT